MDPHPLYAAYTAAASDLVAVEAQVAQMLADARAKVDAAKVALLAALPDGVEVSTVEQHPPIIKRTGDQIEVVTHPFLGTTPAA